jgi:hypothetical protein
MPSTRTPRKKRAASKKAQPRARAWRPRRTKRLIIKPATADEIIRDLGLTAEDLRIIDRVIAEVAPRSGAAKRRRSHR